MSIRTRFKVPPEIKEQVKAKIQEVINDDKLLNKLGDVTTKEVKLKILEGKNPKTDAPFKNPTLTAGWVKKKAQLSSTNTPLSAQAVSTREARLAFTGEWLRSIKHFIVQEGNQKSIEIRPEGKHSRYIGADGAPIGKVVDNRTIGQGLIEQGRDWRGVSQKTARRLVQLIRAFVRRKLKST